MTQRICLVSFVFLTIAGCSTQYHTGSINASLEKSKTIVPGAHTMEDIEQMLGDPKNTIEVGDGEEIWIYEVGLVKHDWGKENFMAVPLFNILSLGANKNSRTTLEREVIRIRFLDEIVDEVVKGKTEMAADRTARELKEFEAIERSNEYEKIEFLPTSYEAPIEERQIDIWKFKGSHKEVLLSFDLSKLPPDSKIQKAYLVMVPEKKKIAAKRIRKKRPDLYAPMVYATGEDWSLLGSGIPAICFKSDCKYNASPESLHRIFTDVLGPGLGRNIYVLNESGKELWDITDLTLSSRNLQKIYLRTSSDIWSEYIGDQNPASAEVLPPLTMYKSPGSGEQDSCKLILYLESTY